MADGKRETLEAGGTRSRLLEAASRVFAEKGYREATVAAICRRAGTNVALINYHFGDKEALYAEAWRLAFSRALEAHPADGGVPVDAPAAKRLRGRVLSLMRRIGDPENREFAIIRREMASPTGLLAVVMHEAILPLHLAFGRLIRELLGEAATDADVALCQMSIISQCMHPMMRNQHAQQLPGGKKPFYSLPCFDIETIADHITRFSLAGIREIRAGQRRGKMGVRSELGTE